MLCVCGVVGCRRTRTISTKATEKIWTKERGAGGGDWRFCRSCTSLREFRASRLGATLRHTAPLEFGDDSFVVNRRGSDRTREAAVVLDVGARVGPKPNSTVLALWDSAVQRIGREAGNRRPAV